MFTDPYATLGVARTATPEDIKAAYRAAAQAAHPDREGGSTEAFQRVSEAYELLSNPDKRAHYDATGNFEYFGEAEVNAAARAELGTFVVHFLHEGPELPPTENAVTYMKGALGRALAEATKNVVQLQKLILRVEVAQKKLKRAKGAPPDDLLAQVLSVRRAELKAAEYKGEFQLKVMRRSIELLSEYDYETERPADYPTLADLDRLSAQGVASWQRQS